MQTHVRLGLSDPQMSGTAVSIVKRGYFVKFSMLVRVGGEVTSNVQCPVPSVPLLVPRLPFIY